MALWAQMRQKVSLTGIFTGIFTGRFTGNFLPAGKIAMKSHVPTNLCRDAAPRSIQYRPNEKTWEGHFKRFTVLYSLMPSIGRLFFFTGSLRGLFCMEIFPFIRGLFSMETFLLYGLFSVGASFVYALYGGFSLWRLCLTGQSVECWARWFLIFLSRSAMSPVECVDFWICAVEISHKILKIPKFPTAANQSHRKAGLENNGSKETGVAYDEFMVCVNFRNLTNVTLEWRYHSVPGKLHSVLGNPFYHSFILCSFCTKSIL